MKRTKLFLKLIKKQRLKLLSLVIVTIVYVITTLLQPLLLGLVIDNIINQDPITNAWLLRFTALLGGQSYIREHLWIGALIVMIIITFASITVFIRSRLNGHISENVALNIKDKLFSHLMSLPYKYFVNSESGDLIQRATSDIDILRRVFAGQISEFFYALSIVSISLIIMHSINPQLMFVAALLLPFIFIFALFFFIRMQKNFTEYDHADAKLTHAISENLAATRVIKAFNREVYESESFDKVNEQLKHRGIKMIDALSFYWGASDFLCFSSILLVIVNGVIMVINNSLTSGQLVVFVSFSGMMVWPLRHLGRIIADFGKVSVSLGRLVEVLEETPEDLVSGITPEIKGNIVLKDVKFHYDDDPKHVLNGINMEIKAGQTVAIIGTTGSGKSSLVHLLSSLYEYSEGEILIDGVELKTYNRHYLRRNIATVLQEPFLFSKTVKENIQITNYERTLEELMNASRIARAEEFIENFELGYETMVGERGTTLSGGQRQRVAIARSVITEAPIIIFDDSLSAVDTQTDKEIRSKLSTIKGLATTIIITQRISSSQDADMIFVLDEGRVSDVGVHDELISKPGLYQRIYNVQTKMIEGDSHGK